MSFHRSEGIEIEGGVVWLPKYTDENALVICTGDAVWLKIIDDVSFVRISIKDGAPFTEGRFTQPKPEDKVTSKSWADNIK